MTKVSLTMIDKAQQKNIKISEISTGERYRKSFNGIEELAKSIEEKGLLNPICVQTLLEETPEGYKYILIAGERRLRAVTSLGRDEIKARVISEPLDELELREVELLENTIRNDFTPAEKTALVKAIHDLEVKKYGKKISTAKDAPGHSAADTAQMLNTSEATVSRSIAVAKVMEAFPEAPWNKCKTQTDLQRLANKLTKTVDHAVKSDKLDKEMEGKDALAALIDSYYIGDCLRGMQVIKDADIDLIEFDPPYAIELNTNKASAATTGYNEVESSEYETFMKAIFKEAYRVLKNDRWFLCWYAIHPWHGKIVEWLEEAGFKVEAPPAIWAKPSGGNARPQDRLTSTYEPFIYASKGSPKLSRMGALNTFLTLPVSPDKKIHPTQRPLSLIKEILSIFTDPGSKVLSPTLGSGTTILAAHACKMKAFGFDLQQNYKDSFKLMAAKYIMGEE